MKIRLLKKNEISICAAIVGKNYGKKYQRMSAAEMEEMFTAGPIKPKFFVAEERQSIVGFAGVAQSWMDYSVWLIFWVNVLPEHQKQGVGKELIARVLSGLRKKKDARLVLLTAKIPNYYKKHFGFQIIDTVQSGDHLMRLRLK